jgi:protein gp37
MSWADASCFLLRDLATHLGETATWAGQPIAGRFRIDPYDVPLVGTNAGIGEVQTWFYCERAIIAGPRLPDIGDILTIRGPRMIFVNSMSDLAHEDMPVEWFAQIWQAMSAARQQRGHIFQVLTKRPANLVRLMRAIGVTKPMPGIWLGVSAEDERRWDERVPLLKAIPTVVPWVSVEPQLELIDRDPKGLGWIVVGGESGKPRSKARSYDAQWGRVMRDHCRADSVPFFMKQLGSFAADGNRPLPTKHYAGADPEEWPADLRVREYPAEVPTQLH